MSETGTVSEVPRTENSAQKYLEKIGPVDRANIELISKTFSAVLSQEGETGFITAVGGTVRHNNPQERKDIDLLVGVKKDIGDISNLTDLEIYEKRYDLWKSTILKVIEPLKLKGVMPEEEMVYPDHEREKRAANDGKFSLNFPTGRVIELLCHQGTEITPNLIELFSNIEPVKAA
ncbi:MAG: hypothetical protein Q7T54_04750 [Candidatus Levybacteria bacterium]|nr:hypothetical protein [Candidatus Levybacteria bacterium]